MRTRTLELGRRDDLDSHDRLKDDRPGGHVDLTDGTDDGETESQLGRIDDVRETIGEDEADADDGVTGQGALLDRLEETLPIRCQHLLSHEHSITHLFTSRNILVRDVGTHELVREGDILAGLLVPLHGLDPTHDTSELTSTTSLLLVGVREIGTLGDSLAVGDTRLTGGAFDVVFTAHTLDVDLQVKFTHTGDDGLRIRSDRVIFVKEHQLTSLLSLSMWTRNVGSSRLNRLSAREKLGVSWPTGFKASEMTGSGTNMEDCTQN